MSVKLTNSFSEIISERRLRLQQFADNFYYECAETLMTTSGLKFHARFEFSVPDFLYGEKFLKSDHDLRYFLAMLLLRMRRNSKNSTSGEIFNPKFETPMGCLIFDYEFWWCLLQDL